MRFSSAAVIALTACSATTAFSPSFVPRNYGSSFVASKNRRNLSAPLAASVTSAASPQQTSSYSTTTSISSSSTSKTATTTTPSLQRSSSISMFTEPSGGMEELQQLMERTDQANPLAKTVRTSPSLFKIAGYATIPLSAALGFGLVPSRRFAAHTVGALVTGLAGAVGKSRLDDLTAANAKPALAQALVNLDKGLDGSPAAANAVRTVQEQFGLEEDDLVLLGTDLYATYLCGMCKFQPTPKTADLKELEHLRTALRLDNLAVGEAHAQAASQWYRQTCLFTPEADLEDPEHPDRMAMDKLLFLTERALRQGGETPEAFTFEFTRVAKALQLDVSTALERVAETVEPFYQRALKSTRSKLGTQQVSSAMLEKARKTLGVSDETAFDMHVAAFNEEVRTLLGMMKVAEGEGSGGAEAARSDDFDVATAKFAEGSVERLQQLQEILGLSDTDAEYEITLEATPLYQSTALAAMKDVLAKKMSPDDAWEIMDARRKELLLPEESSRNLVSSMVMQALGGPLEECNKFAKVNNEAATYDNLLETLDAKNALIAVLTKSGWEDFGSKFDETFCNPWDKTSANGFLVSDERIKLYRIFLTRSVKQSPDGTLTDQVFDRIHQVKGLLGITDQQMEIEARGAFGPILNKVLRTATDEIVQDYTPELAENMKAQIETVLESYHLTPEFLRESGASFYASAVEAMSAKSPGGVPTKELCAALDALRELFRLTKEDTYPAHMEAFGPVYKKSILEAMGSTGVIRPDFREPLEDLRERLSVSRENSDKLFLEAVEEKFIPMAEWIGSEMERTMLSQKELSQRRKKDMGEDLFQTGKGADGVLGLGAEANIMSDIMNLVDFYNENDIAKEEETGTKTVEKKITNEDGEEELVAVEEPVVEMVYPVTALGSGAVDQQMAELLYRQFIVGGFQSPAEQAARYEGARDTFAGILGLTKEKIDEIGSNIGETVYNNFISNAMKTKGTMDQQDMMFLANIQGKLGLTSEQGEKMMMDTQKKLLSEEINALLDGSPDPQSLKAFREKCNSMGMDLVSDVGISKARLTRMFEMEVTPGLKSGEISVENTEVFVEIQESLGLEPEDAEAIFETTLMRLSKTAFELIKSELLRGREDMTIDLIKEIVRYAAFTEGDLALEVDEALGNQVCNVYDSFDFDGQDKEAVEESKALLRTAMGLN